MRTLGDLPSSPFGAATEYHRDHQSSELPLRSPVFRQAGSGSSLRLPALSAPEWRTTHEHPRKRLASRSRPCTVGAFGPVVARRSASTDLNVLRPFLDIRRSVCRFRGGPSARNSRSRPLPMACYGPLTRNSRFSTGVDGPSTEVDRPRRTRDATADRSQRACPRPLQLQQSHRRQKRATHRNRADSTHHFPKVVLRLRAAVELSDTSHGVRCLSTKSASRIVVSDCLPDTVRSQGFSPSQRLHPLETSWLYFTPHPSTGFRPSELFPRESAATPLGIPCSLAVTHIASPGRNRAMLRRADSRALLRSRSRHPPRRD